MQFMNYYMERNIIGEDLKRQSISRNTGNISNLIYLKLTKYIDRLVHAKL